MGTKTINLSEEVYKILLEMKKDEESFSELIMRLTKPATLRDFIGIIPDESCEKLEENIEKVRKDRTELYKEKIDSLNEDMREKRVDS